LGGDLSYRGRLLIYASMAAIGGVLGSTGRIAAFWIPAVAVVLFTAGARVMGKGNKAVLALLCLVFFYSGLLAGHARFAAWNGRGGPAGEVVLEGRVEVGCRGEREDIVNVFKVTGVGEGEGAREGDRYLLRQPQEGGGPLRWGDTLEVRGSLYLFERAGGGIGGSLQAEQIEVLSRSGNPFLSMALAYRGALREQVECGVDASAAGLIEGMVLGDYRMLGARDLLALRRSGLVHLCAASGLHLAILAAFIVWLGARAGISRRSILLLQAPILVTYALAVGLSVPVMRATVVALVAAGAFILGRDFDLLPALGMAMLYLVAVDPGAAAGVSFQLCFAATLGIALLYRPLGALLHAGRSKIMAVLTATLAAQLAVAPLILFHFGEVSVLAVLSNLIVLPLVPVLMAMAMFSSLLGAVGVPLAAPLMQAASIFARAIIVVAHTLSAQHWAAVRIYPLSPAWLGLYYAALAAAFLARGRVRKGGRLVLAALLAAALICGTSLPARVLGHGGRTRVTFIDVGQGDATLLEAASGATVLVDGGKDGGRLAADLRSRGVSFVDVIVVSHPEEDHMGGLEGALEVCDVDMLVHPGTKDDEKTHRFLSRAQEMGVEVRTMRAGDYLTYDDIVITACGPPAEIPYEVSANEYSLVLRVDGPGFSLLCTGDVEEEGEQMLASSSYDLDCDLLKVPHHGGFSHNNEAFFNLVDPEIAVICVGRENTYGHPAQATLNALHRMGCAVYRTDQRGDIVIDVVEGGYRVECER